MKLALACLITFGSLHAWAQEKVQWHDVTQWDVEGRGWGDQDRARWFDRFPAKAEKTVTPAVWNLSRPSATGLEHRVRKGPSHSRRSAACAACQVARSSISNAHESRSRPS